jgi:hypothetical protein
MNDKLYQQEPNEHNFWQNNLDLLERKKRRKNKRNYILQKMTLHTSSKALEQWP